MQMRRNRYLAYLVRTLHGMSAKSVQQWGFLRQVRCMCIISSRYRSAAPIVQQT
jgi:hypothetical protein